MGTPFEGSDTARWTDRFVKLAQLTPDFNVNKTLLDALKQDSHVLKTLGEDFPKWLRDRKGPVGQPIHVMCFYEELSTVGIGQVVPRESASIPGHPSSSMNDNHVGICKFDNFEDPKYKNILHTLRGWVDEIKAAAKSEEPKGVGLNTSERFAGRLMTALEVRCPGPYEGWAQLRRRANRP